MIAHVVLFEPKPGLTDAERTRILDDFRSATETAPTVRRVRVGRRILHGLDGYEQAMQKNFEYAAIVEFDDLEGLRAYLRHPAHATASRHFSESAVAALAYDYALVPAGDAISLVSKND